MINLLFVVGFKMILLTTVYPEDINKSSPFKKFKIICKFCFICKYRTSNQLEEHHQFWWSYQGDVPGHLSDLKFVLTQKAGNPGHLPLSYPQLEQLYQRKVIDGNNYLASLHTCCLITVKQLTKQQTNRNKPTILLKIKTIVS